MDTQEFDDFFASSYSRLTTQVYAMIGDREEAEDCVQEAFARAWTHRRQIESNPEAWVRTTAYRLAVSRWRKAVVRRRPPDRAVAAPLETPAVSETHVALVAALRRIPEQQRRVIVLHHIADLTVDDISRELGVPTGTVKTRLSRGRAALAQLLSEGVSHV